jgi:retron-type reverse transcriptase
LDKGVFLQKLKEAKVVPIHKSGSKTQVSNYRQISSLTSFSRVFEKVMHATILDFLETNKILYYDHYGFRLGGSCQHALLTAQNCLLNSLSNKQISVLLLLDYSKAFDMADHAKLIRKLEHHGIRGKALNWMKSYLENRTQNVTIDGKNSSSKQLTYRVPQGSILGPLLLIIYINDLPEISRIARFILYADDANIILSGTNIDDINEQLILICKKLVKWVASRGLQLNLKKTNHMIFARRKIDLPVPLKISNVSIERKTEACFLGVILDEKLNGNSHVTHL